MTSPFVPSSFTYGDAPQGGVVMPMIIASRNPSNTIDKQFSAGYWWLSALPQGSGNLYYQGGNTGGVPNWTLVSNSGGVLNTLSDGVTTVSPSGGNIALVGTTNQITVTSSAPSHELIFSIPSSFIAPGSISSTTTMTVGSNLTTVGDATIGDDLIVTDDASVGGDLTVSGAIILTDLTVNGTVAINTVGAGTTTVGNAAAGAITFDVGTGDFFINGGGNVVHIADDAVASDISIGNDTGATSVIITAGTGDLLLTGAVTTAITIGDVAQTGLITLGLSTAGQDIDIGSAINTVAQVIDIGNGASAANSTVRILSGTGTSGAGTLALGNNPRVTVAGMTDVAPAASRTTTIGGGTVVVAAVTDTIDIGPDGATTNANSVKTVNINTGGVTLGQVLTNIASGAVTSGTHTTSIASGNRAAGTMALNLMTGTGTKTATLGNADGGTTFNVLGITNINASQNSNTAINSGTSTGTVTIGNSLAGAITVDSGAGISLDAATVSNFTVTGAGADLNLGSVGGSVLVSSTENAALAIYLHANGGISETVDIHADQGTGVSSVNIHSDVGGITIAGGLGTSDAVNITASTAGGGIDIDSSTGGFDVLTTGAVSIDASLASNLTVTGASADLTLSSAGGSVNITATESAADSIVINSTAGGIDILASGAAAGEDIDIIATGSSVNITATEAVANAIVLTASNAAGGIDITTGGGSVDISSAGFVTMLPVTDTQASPTASSTINTNVGAATFTGFTTASAASQTFTIVNSIITTSSKIFVTACNEGANDAQMTISRVKRIAGSMEVTLKNNGAAALNGNVTITFWIIAA